MYNIAFLDLNWRHKRQMPALHSTISSYKSKFETKLKWLHWQLDLDTLHVFVKVIYEAK